MTFLKEGSLKYIDTADTAKLIRARLKAVFPASKFRVRISRYSMGSSIYVEWTDGPTRDRVKREIGGFDNNHFDGMIDMAYTSESWLTKDGRAIWAGTHGTQGSMGVVPEKKIDPTPPEEGAELVHFSGSLSIERRISAKFAKLLVPKIGAYWGGIQYGPEIQETSWGYSIANNTDRTPRDDLGQHSWDPHYCWSSMIRRAAENRLEFTRDTDVRSIWELEAAAKAASSSAYLQLVRET